MPFHQPSHKQPKAESENHFDPHYWNRVAAYYHQYGSPQRPSQEDIRVMENAVAEWSRRRSRPGLKALLCGVTPAIARMTWPERTALLAVDRSKDMIRALWPGDIEGQRRAACGNWLDLSQPDGWFDLIVGDGCFNCLAYPGEYRGLAASLRRVSHHEGLLNMRVFVRPEEPEKPDDVFRDLLAGRIGTFHVFKWRLVMAMQESTIEGVRTGDVWDVWARAGIDQDRLGSMTGWSREDIDTLAPYEGQDVRLSFPTLGELRLTVLNDLEEIEVSYPKYELGERCPILMWRPLRIR